MNDQPQDENLQPTSTSSSSTPHSTDNKNLLIKIAIGLGLLFIILIGLVASLLLKGNNEASTNTTSNTPSSKQSSNENTGSSTKKVVRTYASADDKLDILIYEPRQTGTNTTIDFGIRNKCAGCRDTVYTGSVLSSFDSRTSSYLLDENAGKKYSTITDQDDKVLASPSCSKWLKSDETLDCFVAFSKVPSGTTVSWVFGSTRIDNIKIK